MHSSSCDVGQKVVVIGLDGATFTVLDPLMRKGHLPNLSAVVEEGGRGVLQSTMPPFSASAWASFMTGKNPGKHGLFDFRAPVMVDPVRPFTNATFLRSPSLWKILGDSGKRVGVINVPMTYPPEEVNGFMIGGMVAQGMEEKCFYPAKLYHQVVKAVGEYYPEPDWDQYREDGVRNAGYDVIERLVKEVGRLSRRRGEVGLYALREFDLDFFMVVFTSVDRLQHFAWKHLDPAHADHDPKAAEMYSDALSNYFISLDDMIGDIIKTAGEGVNVVILSDHGFGPQYKKFFINNWLSEKGFLTLQESKRSWRKHLRRFDVSRIRKLLPRSIDKRLRRNFTVFNCIDWSRTKAYAGTSSEQGIFINVKGREPFGIVEPGREYQAVVDEVCGALKGLTDPDTGERVVSKIFPRDDLYWGPCVEFGPDIVFELKGMSYLTKENIGHASLFESSGFESGSHRREGILLMKGPHVQKGVRKEDASLLDLTPTILHLMGFPVDGDMDGKVLTNWLDEEFVERRPVEVKSGDATSGQGERKAVYSDSESEEIESMLKGLGYM